MDFLASRAWNVACSKAELAVNRLQEPSSGRYSEAEFSMTRRVVFVVGFLAILFGTSVTPSYADARSSARTEAQFGVDVAQRGLWREAIYRWQRAVEIDPTYAQAFNNLAVAYEHEGQLDKARQAYEKAIELDPQNVQIRQNYDLFKEINDRAGAEKKEEQP